MYALAKEAYQAERYGECFERCEELLAIYKEEPEAKPALAMLRSIQSSQDKLSRAMEQLDERYAASYFALADAWNKQGKIREAMASYEKAIKLAPNSKLAEAAQLKISTLIRENTENRR
jgi:predicted negative regulator of RcsB-dependent stress response